LVYLRFSRTTPNPAFHLLAITDLHHETTQDSSKLQGRLMKTLTQRHSLSHPFSLSFLPVLAVLAVSIAQAASQQAASSPAVRIHAEISSSQKTALPGTSHPAALAQFDSGRLAAGTKLQGISIYFNRTPSQQADLQTLMAAQQNPASPLYHQWLTPEQFASRFGMADADIAKVQSWLEQQGFSIDSVNRGKDTIRFSGNAGQVEAAFNTEMHTYALKTAKGVENHFAPSTALSVPSAMAGVVLGVRNLDDFRPRSHLVTNKGKTGRPRPAFTGFDSSLFFAPGDVAVEYDLNKEYHASYSGSGQTIAVIGQSEVELSDIENFQNAAGLAVKDPALTYVPGSGTPAFSPGDWTESDIDLEWSGAIAPGASISLIYVGSNQNYSAFDALDYAIDNKLANIISSSYGQCEAELTGETLASGSALEASLEADFQRAATQGQTILSAAGDDGATDCFLGQTGVGFPTQAEQQALAVDYPGSSAYVTSVGGTEISQANSDYLLPGDGYWEASNNTTDIVTSVLQYIPEQAWNEDSANCGETDCLASGGGGASTIFSKPSYQTALTPADGHRDVPDIALNAAINNPGYLFCTSDTSDWLQGQQASCNSGFRDAASEDPTWAGGTSFAAPIFAGMLALINQQQGYTTGQGPVNPTLYTLAGNSGTYATAFHDITTGNNSCPSGTDLCSSAVTGFSAKTGYDQATGLGTVDLFNLATAWPAGSGTGPSLIATTTSVAASSSAPTVNASDNFTITVAASSGSVSPTGTVTITVDSLTPVTETLTSNGTFVYATSFTTAGPHTVLVAYSGDSTFAASTGSVTVTAAAVNSGTGTFKISATNITVTQGSVGSSTVTVTPAGGYTGTVQFSISTTSTDLQNDSCPNLNNIVVSNASPATGTLTIDTNAANCLNTGDARKGKFIRTAGIGAGLSGRGGPVTAIAVFAGLLLAGFLGRYSRKLRVLAGVILLATIGMAFTGCGGNGSNTVSNAPKGNYTLTITGTDSASTTIPSATTTLTLTIQ
jgi:subtilase family serine protease